MSRDQKSQSVIVLPAVLNSAQASQLATNLRARSGDSLTLDASKVTMIGGQCLQVLLAARSSWDAGDADLEVANLSDEMVSGLAVLGIAAAQLSTKETVYAG